MQEDVENLGHLQLVEPDYSRDDPYDLHGVVDDGLGHGTASPPMHAILVLPQPSRR